MEKADIFFLQEYSEMHTITINFEYYTVLFKPLNF